MPTLETIQQAWLDDFINQPNQLTIFIKSNALTPNDRIIVYQHTIKNNLVQGLKITFPGIWSLLGDTYANLIAKRFIQLKKYLPKTGCLDDWGDTFPKFIAKIPELKNLVYLYDYALLEWLLHLSYCAKPATTMNVSDWQEKMETGLDNLATQLHPSVFLLKSHFPLQKIHELIINPDNNPVNLQDGGSYAVIAHHQIYWINAPLWHFLVKLKQGCCFIKALEKNIADFPEFNLAEVLQFLLEKQLVCRVIEAI